MNSQCENCNIRPLREHTTPVVPDYRPGEILIVSDFPVIEDTESNLAMSGLHKRTTFVSKLLDDAKMDPDTVSYSTILRCITKSKAIISIRDYDNCGTILLEEIAKLGFRGALCFGSVAGSVLTGTKVTSIEKIRGNILESVIPGMFVVITYSLGILVDTVGCGGCGGNVHPNLARKDVKSFYKEFNRRKDAESKVKKS